MALLEMHDLKTFFTTKRGGLGVGLRVRLDVLLGLGSGGDLGRGFARRLLLLYLFGLAVGRLDDLLRLLR